MSYDEQDAAMDEFYDQISKELYPEHKEQAIEEFTQDKRDKRGRSEYFLTMRSLANL